MRLYTPKQVKAAHQARRLYHSLGRPRLEDFKKMIRMNTIHQCPVSINDVDIAEVIFGKDVGALKGKSTRKKPAPITRKFLDIPKVLIQMHQNIALCMDIMHVNGMPFLTTVSKNLLYRTASRLSSLDSDKYLAALKAIFLVYNHAGFLIKQIDCDNAFQKVG